jgi:hypothetical protein
MRKHATMGILLAPLFAACSAGSGSSGDPPVDPAKELSALSPGDVQALCDWGAQEQGGYGTTVYCEASGTPRETASTQTECVAEVTPMFGRATCTTTVGQYTGCVKWFVANWCSAVPPALPAECMTFQSGCYGTQFAPDAGTD